MNKTLNLLITSCSLFLCISIGHTQDKRDYNWFFGQDQLVGPDFRALEFNFNDRPFAPSLRDKGLKFDQNNVSISTKESC